jgi:hypothetical protein
MFDARRTITDVGSMSTPPEAGVIHQREEGTSRLNGLRREDLEARFPGLLPTILQAASANAHA